MVSDLELLASMLNTGIKGKNVMVLAKELREFLYTQNGVPSVEELQKIAGIGLTKAATISAMLEFGYRRWGIKGLTVLSPKDAYMMVRHYAFSDQENFITISLTAAHEVICSRVVSVGTANKTLVHPREVFANVITDKAVSMIAAHNHPSGRLLPSSADHKTTRNLCNAAGILGIRFVDHIIFNTSGYYSLLKAANFTDLEDDFY
jgi:DNA repair protein RadC